MYNNQDEWVDAIVDELNKLYNKDTDVRKGILGNQFIKTVFDQYIDWIMMHQDKNPIQISRTIYKDLKGINYFDFNSKKLTGKTGMKNDSSFQLIYGTPDEINTMHKHLALIKNKDKTRYDLILTALEHVKKISSKVTQTSMNFSGAKMVQDKTTNSLSKMPRYSTFLTFMKMPTADLQKYVRKLEDDLRKLGV